MKRPTTIDKNKFKWPVCLTLALLIFLQAVPVMATEQQTDQTETPTVTEVTGSESAQKSEASGEQNQPLADELEPVQPIDTEEAALTANTDWTTTKPHEGEVLHGGYVGFKNKASGKYLTIPNGATATGTNVCQQASSFTANAQEFYLSYTYLPNKSIAYFTIYPVNASGNTTSTRIKSAAISSSGVANVSLQIFMPTEMTDRWQIVHAHDNYYYIYIASRPDATGTKYALTANSGNGTASGTSTTATGNVYVSAYTGANNQLWQICADGKPMDINGVDITSQNTQSYIYPGESIAYYYVPKSFNQTLSWTSITEACTVSTQGLVTAQHVGSGILRLLVSTVGSNSLLSLYSSVCHVLLEDGYYYIKSYDEDYLMDLEGGSTNENTPIQVCHTGGVVESNNQIFRFVHVGEGCYNIIPLKTETKGLRWSADTADVLNNDVSSSGTLHETAKWKLRTCKYTVDGVAYYGVNIHANTGTGKTITIPESYEDCTNLITASYSATNTRQIWQICGDHVDIVNLWLFGDLVAGEQYDFPLYCIGVTGTKHAEWNVISGADVVLLGEIGKFSTMKPGTAEIRVCIYSSPQKEVLIVSETYSITVYPSPSEGDFFIQNAISEKILSTSGSTLPGSAVMQVDFADHYYHEWEFVYVSDNYFRIKSKAAGFYLTAPTSLSGSVTQGATPNDYSLWKIIPTSGNRYKIISKVYESSNVVLASPSASSTILCLTPYTDNTNYLDEWGLLISGTELTILSVADCNMKRAQASLAAAEAESAGIECNVIVSDRVSVNAVITGIKTSEVFVSRSHGSHEVIQINGQKPRDSSDALYLRISNIYDYTLNAPKVDFSGCELIAFIGCSTASNEFEHNITQAAVDAGADAAIGFETSISASHANIWMQSFLYFYLEENDPIPIAIETANAYFPEGEMDSVRLITNDN